MLANIYFLHVEHKNQAEQTLDNESLAEWWNDGDNNIHVLQESMILAMVNTWQEMYHCVKGERGYIPELSETENKNGTNSYEFHCPYAYSYFMIPTTYYNLE